MRRTERPPRHNPYETFTSQDLDDFVADIRDKVTLALKPPPRDDLPCLRASRSSGSFFTPLKPHSHNRSLTTRPTLLDEPITANGKGKARALDEGPGVKGLANIASEDRHLHSPTQSPIPPSDHSEVDTGDETDHPADDSMRYRKYYHATVEGEDEEEADGEDDDQEEMYEEEEYDAEYGDQNARATSVGHERQGRDYREDEDGAIVIDSDDEGDDPQNLSGPGLSSISPEWPGQSYEDGEQMFEEDEDSFHQEAITGNIESQVYDEDPQLDELDDEIQIIVNRDEETRDRAVFNSDDQDVLPIGRNDVMQFEGVTGSVNLGYDVSGIRDEPIDADEDPVYESMFGASNPMDIPPPHLPSLSFAAPIGFSPLPTTSHDSDEHFSMPVPQPEMSQIDPNLFESAVYPMPIPMPYPYTPPVQDGATAGLWAIDSLAQPTPPLPSSGPNSEWLDQIIFNSAQPPPSATVEGNINHVTFDEPLESKAMFTPPINQIISANQVTSETNQDAVEDLPQPFREEIAHMFSTGHPSNTPRNLPISTSTTAPVDDVSDVGLPPPLAAMAGDSTNEDTPAAASVDEPLTKTDSLDVYEVEDMEALPEEGPAFVEEPRSREDPYPDYLSVHTATTEELIDLPDAMTPFNPLLEQIGEEEAGDTIREQIMFDDGAPGTSTEINDHPPALPAYDPSQSGERMLPTDPDRTDVPQDEEEGEQKSLPDEKSSTALSPTQPDVQYDGTTQTLASEEVAGAGRESADIDGMAVNLESDEAGEPEEIPLEDDPFTHMGTGKGGPGEVVDGNEEEEESDSMSTSDNDLKVYGEQEETPRQDVPAAQGQEAREKLSVSRGISNSPSPEHPDDGMELESDEEHSDHTSHPGTEEPAAPDPPSRSSPAFIHHNLRSADTSPSKASSSSFLMPPESPLSHRSHDVEMPPPPIARLTSYNLYRHHHGPLPVEQDVPPRSRRREDDRASQASGPSIAASRISTSQMSFSSPRDTNAPVTRSHCRFHRIAIPAQTGPSEASDDDGRTYFIVPGCSLAAQDVIKDEGIDICGEASKEQNDSKIPEIESLPLDPDVVSILRKMVGHEVMVTACAWLPSEAQASEYRRKRHAEDAAALKAASSRHPRRKSANTSLRGKRASVAPNLANDKHRTSPAPHRGSLTKRSRTQHHSDNEIEEPDPLQSAGTADEGEQSEDLHETASVDFGDPVPESGGTGHRLSTKRRRSRKSTSRKIEDTLYTAVDTEEEEEEDEDEDNRHSKRRRNSRRKPKIVISALEPENVVASQDAEGTHGLELDQNSSKKRGRAQPDSSRKRRKQDAGEDDSASLISLDDVEPSSTANSVSAPVYPNKGVEVEVLLDPPSHHLRSADAAQLTADPQNPTPIPELASPPVPKARWWNPFR